MGSKIIPLHILFVLLGFIVSGYTLHIEAMLVNVPGYEPSCDSSRLQMSCSKVFSSKYAKILSYWGLVTVGSAFDFSLPQLAIAYFSLALSAPAMIRRIPSTARFFRIVSYCAVAFNLYLAYILKFKLGEFCIVCVTNYVINGVLFFTTLKLTSIGEPRIKKD
jgi:uncharacterized membrane protein